MLPDRDPNRVPTPPDQNRIPIGPGTKTTPNDLRRIELIAQGTAYRDLDSGTQVVPGVTNLPDLPGGGRTTVVEQGEPGTTTTIVVPGGTDGAMFLDETSAGSWREGATVVLGGRTWVARRDTTEVPGTGDPLLGDWAALAAATSGGGVGGTADGFAVWPAGRWWSNLDEWIGTQGQVDWGANRLGVTMLSLPVGAVVDSIYVSLTKQTYGDPLWDTDYGARTGLYAVDPETGMPSDLLADLGMARPGFPLSTALILEPGVYALAVRSGGAVFMRAKPSAIDRRLYGMESASVVPPWAGADANWRYPMGYLYTIGDPYESGPTRSGPLPASLAGVPAVSTDGAVAWMFHRAA